MDENNQEKIDAEVQSGDETTAESQADMVDRQAFEDQKKRAEKLEAQLKELKQAQEAKDTSKDKPKEQSKGDTLSAEEIRMIAKHDDEGLDKLRKIAAVEGVSLSEAEKSDLFQAWKEKREQELRQEKAQLRASKGAGGSSSKPLTFEEAGKDPEAHKKMLNAFLYGKK